MLSLIWYCLLTFSMVAVFCSPLHVNIKSIILWVCFPLLIQKCHFHSTGKGKVKNRKKKYYKTEFWCFQLTWCDHTGCFLKNFTPHVKDKVIFPPCRWNRSTKIKLWETSSIRNTDRVAMQTRQIHQKICSMGLPLLIFYDIFLSLSITLTETQTTSSCLWCVTGTSPQHVSLPCAFYLHLHAWEAEQKKSDMFFCLFSFSLKPVNVECCGETHRDKMALFTRANTKRL